MRIRNSIGILAVAVASLVATTSASAAVSVGQSGWTWGSPRPQGNDLRVIEFAGGRGYAAGNFGTILRTDDAGVTWTGLRTGTTQDLFRLRAVDADTFVVGGGCTLRRSDDAGETFRRIPFTPSERNCGAGVTSFSFVDENLGYTLLADGTVQRTANGGQSLARRTAVPGTAATGGSAQARDIYFLDSDTGVAITDKGAIYRTTDGAESWVLVAFTFSRLNGLFFTNAMIGYAVGENNGLFRTEDGGQTWAQAPAAGDVPRSDLTSIRCASATSCLIATASGERLLRTSDGGATVSSVTPSTQRIFAVALQSDTRAVAVGEAGATVVSANAGETFATIGARLSGRFLRLRATSSQIAHAPGNDGALARTLDGGETWTTVGVATSEDVLDVSFLDQDVGFALDVRGGALRTDNGGVDWQFLDTGTTDPPRAVLALDPQRVLLVGPRGIRRSTDGGAVFQGVADTDALRSILSDIDPAKGGLVAYGEQSLILSTDGGATWRPLPRPGPVVKKRRPALVAVDFTDTRTGYAVTTNGTGSPRVWRTANGGRAWTELTGVGANGIIDVAFGTATSGWLTTDSFAGQDGYVLRTSDGGRTWRPQLLSPFGILRNGLVAPAGSDGFALNSRSDLFGTRTGGDAEQDTALSLRTPARSVRRRGKKPAAVTVTGRLQPAIGGADIVVSRRDAAGGRWQSRTARVSSNGTFTTSWNITRTSNFVAQWRGDEDHNGDGSSVLTINVRVAPRPRPAR